MASPFARFDRLDTRVNQWLVRRSIPLLRISLGLVFLGFGALKFFPGLSPAQDLVVQTTTALTFGLVPPGAGLGLVAALECGIGLCFLTGRFLRVAVWLMLAQMLGAMSPLLLFPAQLFAGPGGAPTLAAQYIIKDIVLVAAALVIASTWTGARIVPEPRTMRGSLGAGPPVLTRAERSCGRNAANSLPDELFARVCRHSERLGLSRSEFFAVAAGRWADELDGGELTAAIDHAVAEAGPDNDNPFTDAAALAVLARTR
jgi:putative oxidoreductase